ncbi:MAG: TolC family protein, partial [Alphaproteobacteria bacterium]|nr:TolC family protein [Alphaproteobacteria bacterium]
AGQSSALDLARERISRAQMDLAIRDLERARAEARVQLATAIGVPARALDGVTVSLDAFETPASPPAALTALRRRALTGRSDVEAGLAEYRAADAALRLQVANQYPNLAIGPAYNWGAIDTTRISNQIGLPLNVELPLFHRNQGPIAEAAARRRQAAAGLTALQAQVIGQVDAAVAAWRADARTLATADALQADAERRAARVRDSFRAGAVDRPTLVTAELERAVAAGSRFDALVAERQSLGGLEDALQQPLFGPALAPAGAEEPRE